MRIENSTIEDIETIIGLYQDAVAYQKIVAEQPWEEFDQRFIETEIREQRQWKIVIDDQIACVFALSFYDATVKEEARKEQAIYIHRIATNPLFRGNSFVKYIVAWSKIYGRQTGKEFVRVLTVFGNLKLNNYLISCGFNYMGIVRHGNGEASSAKHKPRAVALFEIVV